MTEFMYNHEPRATSHEPRATSHEPRATSHYLLSVIITSYNEIEYLPQAIESCLSQTFQDFEIIIGDDGSDDGSIELIKNYCEKYPGKIKYFVMARPADNKNIIPSLRVSNVIKTALKKANGKYICLLSGDDYFCDDKKFADAVKFLNSQSEKYSAYVSGYKKVLPDKTEKISHAPYPRKLFWAGVYIHVSSFVFRKSVFDDGFFVNRFCDDTGLIFSTALAGKWKFTDKITFAYRQREGSIMHKSSRFLFMLIELMLFQDCLCKRKMIWSSYSRFYGPLKYVYTHRAELSNPACKKYFTSCEPYENNIIAEVAKCDSKFRSKLFIISLIFKGKIASVIFLSIGLRVYKVPGKLKKICKKILRLS